MNIFDTVKDTLDDIAKGINDFANDLFYEQSTPPQEYLKKVTGLKSPAERDREILAQTRAEQLPKNRFDQFNLPQATIGKATSGKKDILETTTKTEESKLSLDRAKNLVMGFAGTSPQKLVTGVEEKLINPLEKIVLALKESKPIRKQQETLYSTERGKRLAESLSVGKTTSGEKGFYAELGKLKGELPKVQFESIRNKVSQEDIDFAFDSLKNSNVLNEWDKITARTGLGKLFGEFGGRVPTEGELILLNRVFPKEFTDTLLSKRDLWTKTKEVGREVLNIPRSIMSSFDLSAPLRQGLFLIGKPKQFIPAFRDMIKSFASEEAYTALNESIIRKPNFKLMNEVKLGLTQMDSILSQREEQFMSNFAEKIPGIGRVVKASGRAYTGFLNKLRADVFDDLINKADSLGLDPKKNIDLAKGISDFINNATGRGSIKGLERSFPVLNSFFFSPRLMASRLNLLNPVYYVKQEPFVRKEALKALFTTTGVIGTVLSLAKAGGADIETDPRSSDFGKIKVGNTRFDIMGGFQQYIRSAAQLITGKQISTTTGKEYTLGEGYGSSTRLDIAIRQLRSKLAPVPSFVVDFLAGGNMAGEDFELQNELLSRFTPMMLQDMSDLIKEDPSLLPVGILGGFGIGVQTYGKKKTENIFNN